MDSELSALTTSLVTAAGYPAMQVAELKVNFFLDRLASSNILHITDLLLLSNLFSSDRPTAEEDFAKNLCFCRRFSLG